MHEHNVHSSHLSILQQCPLQNMYMHCVFMEKFLKCAEQLHRLYCSSYLSLQLMYMQQICLSRENNYDLDTELYNNIII